MTVLPIEIQTTLAGIVPGVVPVIVPIIGLTSPRTETSPVRHVVKIPHIDGLRKIAAPVANLLQD